MFNPERALELIKQHGVYGLCGPDGCACTSFEIHGVCVNISCRKSDHSVRVYSHHCDSIGADLQPVMDAVLHDVGEYLGGDPIKEYGYATKFVSWEEEHSQP